MKKLFYLLSLLFIVSCSPCGGNTKGNNYYIVFTDGHSTHKSFPEEVHLTGNGCVEASLGKTYMCGVRTIEKSQ